MSNVQIILSSLVGVGWGILTIFLLNYPSDITFAIGVVSMGGMFLYIPIMLIKLLAKFKNKKNEESIN
jgi:hypothetical protein